MKRILMANDLSKRSDRALKRAALLASQFDADLEVLTVIAEMLQEDMTRHNQAFAQQALAVRLAGLPEAKGVRISQRVIVGLDFDGIVRRSEELDAELVVLGSHRHKARDVVRGTTVERVLRYGSRPVLVVKNPVTGPYHHVLVATDLSQHAEAAATVAARLAPKGMIHLMHVVHQPLFPLAQKRRDANMDHRCTFVRTQLTEVIDRLSVALGESAPQFDILLAEGAAPGVIHAKVSDLKPDLLAIGAHGRSVLADAVLGSVAGELLAYCPVDILAVKAS